MPPVSGAVRDELIAEVRHHMLPAITAQDCAAFGESLYRYGRLAGMCFAPVQGGPYNGPQIEQLVHDIRRWESPESVRVRGDPTVFCVVEDQDAAERLACDLPRRCSVAPLAIQITPADNHGAVVTCEADANRRRAPPAHGDGPSNFE